MGGVPQQRGQPLLPFKSKPCETLEGEPCSLKGSRRSTCTLGFLSLIEENLQKRVWEKNPWRKSLGLRTLENHGRPKVSEDHLTRLSLNPCNHKFFLRVPADLFGKSTHKQVLLKPRPKKRTEWSLLFGLVVI